MLTIDWKERLDKDTEDYFIDKLPKKDYDFEIIFIAYPERVNGKIPPDVIIHVAGTLLKCMGKNHEQYAPFIKHLWARKGEYGRQAFVQIISKLFPKRPMVYLPILEAALASANPAEMNMIMERVMLPLLRKSPEKYLPQIYAWSKSDNPELRKQAMNTAIKLIKKVPEQLREVFGHYQHLWYYPLEDNAAEHIQLFKTVGKLDPEYFLEVARSFENNRDPQIVELVCGSIQDYDAELERIVGDWTKSGNARVKKAATAAQRLLSRKKGKA